ncbi:MAG: Fic family protein [Firmicutes bacterium]|nr:Fic family protein [Bacillota bacterium]
MKTFNYLETSKNLFAQDVVTLLTAIHEYKGKQLLYIEAQPDVLASLLEIAKIQSTVSSNRIEGISTTDKRINELLKEKSSPKNRDEQEIIGYQNVLNTIHDNYDYISPSSNIILQLHRDLYAATGLSYGGRFKDVNNVIQETNEFGESFIRFEPLSAFETPSAIIALCNEFINVIQYEKIEPLLAIPMFILDFLCIHPFLDGNGRMSRLLTLLLLYRSGYLVGKYISIEQMIEKNKRGYYDSLQASSQEWNASKNDYKPFVSYFLQIVLSAYQEFDSRVSHVSKKMNSYQRVKIIFESHIGRITKAEIIEKCSDISPTTIELVLSNLLKEGFIIKIGGGRYTSYSKTNN